MPLVCVDVVRSCFVVAGEQKGDQKSIFFYDSLHAPRVQVHLYSIRVVVHRTKVQYSAPTRLASVCSDVTGKFAARKFCRGDNNLG